MLVLHGIAGVGWTVPTTGWWEGAAALISRVQPLPASAAMELPIQQHLRIVLLGSREHPDEGWGITTLDPQSDTCSLLHLSYKRMVVTWMLSSPCNVPDMAVKKLDGTVHDGIRLVSLKGWEVGRVFHSFSKLSFWVSF